MLLEMPLFPMMVLFQTRSGWLQAIWRVRNMHMCKSGWVTDPARVRRKKESYGVPTIRFFTN